MTYQHKHYTTLSESERSVIDDAFDAAGDLIRRRTGIVVAAGDLSEAACDALAELLIASRPSARISHLGRHGRLTLSGGLPVLLLDDETDPLRPGDSMEVDHGDESEDTTAAEWVRDALAHGHVRGHDLVATGPTEAWRDDDFGLACAPAPSITPQDIDRQVESNKAAMAFASRFAAPGPQ